MRRCLAVSLVLASETPNDNKFKNWQCIAVCCINLTPKLYILNPKVKSNLSRDEFKTTSGGAVCCMCIWQILFARLCLLNAENSQAYKFKIDIQSENYPEMGHKIPTTSKCLHMGGLLVLGKSRL
mmetsp:Transcript_95959/g.140217  ORF Transcript_95959/g.140217 Transcript_95959/m.140217 type:complete len:125 (+) Transcript_95959:283-657(+)